MAGTLVLIQKRHFDASGLGGQQLGVKCKKKKYKGSLVTPLGPGDLVSNAPSMGRQSCQNRTNDSS